MTDENKQDDKPVIESGFDSLDQLAAAGNTDENGLPEFDKRLFQFIGQAAAKSSSGIALAPAQFMGKPTSLIVGVVGRKDTLAETIPLYIRVTEEIYELIRMPDGRETAKSYEEAAKLPPTIVLPPEDEGCKNPACPVHGDPSKRVHAVDGNGTKH